MNCVKVFPVFAVLFFSLTAFVSQPDADAYFESGKKHRQNNEFVKAISDYTMAISLCPDFGNAYLERGITKLTFSHQAGFTTTEYCFDFIQALNLGMEEAASILKENCSNDCYSLQKAVLEPDIVFCADLSSKTLTDLPAESLLLTNLIKLNLFNNRLIKTPSALTGFRSLQNLDLSSNRLKEIDSSIAGLNRLEELNLNKNDLRELPVQIGHLKYLKKLYLKSNLLSEIPAEISKCVSLENLDLSGNRLTVLPPEFFALSKLQMLNLVGNIFDKKSQKMIRSRMPHTTVYF